MFSTLSTDDVIKAIVSMFIIILMSLFGWLFTDHLRLSSTQDRMVERQKVIAEELINLRADVKDVNIIVSSIRKDIDYLRIAYKNPFSDITQ